MASTDRGATRSSWLCSLRHETPSTHLPGFPPASYPAHPLPAAPPTNLCGLRGTVSIIRRLGSARQEHFRHIGRKLMVLSHQETLLDDRQGILDDVLEGLLKQKVLRVHYEHFKGDREELNLTPYSLVVSSGWLYVISPNATGQLHPFRFARLLSAEVTATTFDYPSGGEYDPEALFRDSFGVFLNLPVQDVRLRVNERWRSFLKTHRWHPSQTMSLLTDGSVEVRYRVRVCPEFRGWILSFGPEVEVLEPEELRAWIVERAKQTAARYLAQNS